MKKVVLFGDSLTDFFPMELLTKDNIIYINAGTAGETLPEMKIRIGEDVIVHEPDVVIIQGGANDYLSPLYQGAEKVAGQLVDLGVRIQKNLPKAEVYIESLYPVYPRRLPGDIYSWAEGKSKEEICRINSMVKCMCGESSPIYVDMYVHLADENGELALKDTVDGVHLSRSGYEKIASVIKELVS
ncbi:MAG: GDSL-type esterase/lipase family protein [Anaerostipes sp.]|nr:GDSL-type esterase/lipase family protein [Anaerostipes sp.]MDD3746587.1 GDSL-type esterase/lipase family protein [Anaerostipes sp.]